MTDSNRLQLSYVREVTIGTTPGSPSMTKVRAKGETLDWSIDNIRSEEIRSDRLTPDLVTVNGRANGGFPFELSYGAFDDFIESALANLWTEMPELSNGGVADSVLTNVANSSSTYTVASGGSSYKAGHLVRTTGFTNSGNNGLFRVASSTGTTVVVTGTLTDESAPPGAARMKVVGFRGASGDITAAAGGLASSSLDFTTLGLSVGQWVKIGGASAGEQFATAALNDWARITAISANALTLDNKPSGWTTDSGTSKTITVYVGDFIRPGTTKIAHSIEKVLLGQGTPAYILYKGMIVNQMSLQAEAGQILTGSFDFLGFNAVISSSPQDASPDEAPQNEVLNAVSNFGRVALGGSVVTTPNYIKSVSLSISNNLREQTAIGTLGLIGVGMGDIDITGQMTTYFGSKDLYEAFINNTASSFNFRANKDSKALVFTFPRFKFENGKVQATGRNQDVYADISFRALRDTTTGTSFQIDRFEEYA